MANLTLYQLTEEQQRIEDLLIENGGEITPEIEEALTANQEALSLKLEGYNKILRKFEGAETSIAAEIKRLQGLKKTAANAQASLKRHLLETMQQQGINRIDGDLCKAYIRESEVTEIDDFFLQEYYDKVAEISTDLPDYLTISVDLNKTRLKEHLKAGETLRGARIAKNPSVILK